MEADLGGEEMSLEGEGSFTADRAGRRHDATMLSEGENLKFEAIAADGTVYLKSDEFKLPAGKEWLTTPDPPTSTMKPDEFVRHLRESQEVTAPEKLSGAMTMTADILEYDVPVDAEAPPAGKVAELSDLRGG